MADNNKKIVVTDTQMLRRNLLISFVLVILMVMLYATIPGYNFAVKDVAIHNKERIDQIETRRLNFNRPELTLEDKRLFKIEDYWYIQFIRDHTPMNAVILLPPKSAVDSTAEFNFINSSEWMEYFMFPRLCISEDEKNTKPELYGKVDYVAIVNGWGYDKLHYVPQTHPSEAIFPVEKPKVDSSKASNIEALKPVILDDTTLKTKTNEQE